MCIYVYVNVYIYTCIYIVYISIYVYIYMRLTRKAVIGLTRGENADLRDKTTEHSVGLTLVLSRRSAFSPMYMCVPTYKYVCLFIYIYIYYYEHIYTYTYAHTHTYINL